MLVLGQLLVQLMPYCLAHIVLLILLVLQYFYDFICCTISLCYISFLRTIWAPVSTDHALVSWLTWIGCNWNFALSRFSFPGATVLESESSIIRMGYCILLLPEFFNFSLSPNKIELID